MRSIRYQFFMTPNEAVELVRGMLSKHAGLAVFEQVHEPGIKVRPVVDLAEPVVGASGNRKLFVFSEASVGQISSEAETMDASPMAGRGHDYFAHAG